jgi:hypothetical protein
MTEHHSEIRVEKTVTEARAGVTGHHVRYVLAASLMGVMIFFVGLLYFWNTWDQHRQWRNPMELILIIVVLVLLFGGGGGYWGRSRGFWWPDALLSSELQ